MSAELVWLHSLFLELNIPLSIPTMVWCDNLSAVHLSANLVLHSRAKHIEIDIHFVRDLVLRNQLSSRHLFPIAQVEDIFMKPFSASRFLTT